MVVPPGCVAYLIEDMASQDEWLRALVLLNASARLVEMEIPEGKWQVFADNKEASTISLRLGTKLITGRIATVAPRSALILGEIRVGNAFLLEQPFTNDDLST